MWPVWEMFRSTSDRVRQVIDGRPLIRLQVQFFKGWIPHGAMLTVIRLNFSFDFDKVAIMHATLQRHCGFNCEQHNHNTVTTQTALKLDAYITEVVDCAHHIAFKSKKQVRSIIRSSLSHGFLTCLGMMARPWYPGHSKIEI